MEGTTTSDSPRSVDAPSDIIPRLSEPVLQAIEAHLRTREQRREELYQRARRLRRAAQHVMTLVHESRPVDAELVEVGRMTQELASSLDRDGRGDESLVRDALQESVEAALLVAVVQRRSLPGPEDLQVEPEPYLLGLGDVVGEIRRLALDRLGQGDVAMADAYVDLMDALYRALLRFDTTRAIVALKPKQDTARALVERTRGEVTMARVLMNATDGSSGRKERH